MHSTLRAFSNPVALPSVVRPLHPFFPPPAPVPPHSAHHLHLPGYSSILLIGLLPSALVLSVVFSARLILLECKSNCITSPVKILQ